MFSRLVLIVMTLVIGSVADAQEKYPIPGNNANQLFYLQKNTNTNTIVCELNYHNGYLDEDEPVHVFWIRYQEGGQKKELNLIQEKFAYGIKSTRLSKDKYKMHFVSLKKHPMFLKKGGNNKFNVYATINKKEAILHRIFVKIIGGTFWSPDVEYIELKGIDPATGLEMVERVKV